MFKWKWLGILLVTTLLTEVIGMVLLYFYKKNISIASEMSFCSSTVQNCKKFLISDVLSWKGGNIIYPEVYFSSCPSGKELVSIMRKEATRRN